MQKQNICRYSHIYFHHSSHPLKHFKKKKRQKSPPHIRKKKNITNSSFFLISFYLYYIYKNSQGKNKRRRLECGGFLQKNKINKPPRVKQPLFSTQQKKIGSSNSIYKKKKFSYSPFKKKKKSWPVSPPLSFQFLLFEVLREKKKKSFYSPEATNDFRSMSKKKKRNREREKEPHNKSTRKK